MRLMSSSRRTLATAVLLGTLMIGATACSSSTTPSDVGSAPQLAHPTATARGLVNAWLAALKSGNKKAIAGFLAPNFLIQRADGSTSDREQYLQHPPIVSTFKVSKDLIAIQDGDSLSVRWSVEVDEIINGTSFKAGDAPRLTSFQWTGSRWQIATYANFNLPS
jgi:hypothetical protein